MGATCVWRLGLYPLMWSVAAILRETPSNLDVKILQVTTVAADKLKCFTQTLEDFTCVWDEQDWSDGRQYRFFYQYQDGESKKECQLSVETLGGNTTRHICSLPLVEVSLFAPLDIDVLLNTSIIMSKRDLYINHMVVLDPLTNVTVRPTGKAGQLHIRWSPPPFKYLGNSLMYEVNFSMVSSSVQKVETVKGKTECTIVKLKPQTKYVVRIRAKPDGVSMDGYWTSWSKPVSAFTDSDLDPLIISLTTVLILITALLLLMVLLSHRRMIKEVFWPRIPSPDNMFDGLFTVYQGNFQEWLGQKTVQVWWNQQFFSTDDPSTALEVLSEIKTFPPCLAWGKRHDIFHDDRTFLLCESEAFKLQHQWGPMDGSKTPDPLVSTANSRAAYVVLNQNLVPNDHGLPEARSPGQGGSDVSEEEMPLQLLFMDPGMKCRKEPIPEEGEGISLQLPSLSRQSSQSSGIGRESPDSFATFDYAKCDPTGRLLYPNPTEGVLGNTNHPYLLMLDSGVSADFSINYFPSDISKSDADIYTNLCKREDVRENILAPNALHVQA
ncbi:erythropoietin receptor [Amblyraja radiata]|uniref:erythropoietin receptor n=1 Tax=Amblyraja radiata TaxID=386614 RepID=UPI001402E2C7|nr:erythropoietin receptor [Amblyraja radiata]